MKTAEQIRALKNEPLTEKEIEICNGVLDDIEYEIRIISKRGGTWYEYGFNNMKGKNLTLMQKEYIFNELIKHGFKVKVEKLRPDLGDFQIDWELKKEY